MEKILFTKKAGIVFLLLSALLLIPNLFAIHLKSLPLTANPAEKFDPALAKEILSIDDLLKKADLIAAEKSIKQHTLAYTEILTSLVRSRFYHGYSHYSLRENWMAAVSGAVIWNDLSAIVLPDDILKYPMAACSQQSIVLAESFKRKGFPYRKIGFDHHFALEAKVGDQWYFFDPDMEPDFTKVARASIDVLIKDKALYEIYKTKLKPNEVDHGLANPVYNKPNEALAPTASLFHRITAVLSRLLFLFPLLIFIALVKKKRAVIRSLNVYQNAKACTAVL
jgi:hypothetical protein